MYARIEPGIVFHNPATMQVATLHQQVAAPTNKAPTIFSLKVTCVGSDTASLYNFKSFEDLNGPNWKCLSEHPIQAL